MYVHLILEDEDVTVFSSSCPPESSEGDVEFASREEENAAAGPAVAGGAAVPASADEPSAASRVTTVAVSTSLVC